MHRGSYKNSSNKVVAKYPDGTQRTLFDPTPSHLAPEEMTQLIEWLNERIHKQDMHPLVFIAGFVYEFLSIHPYKDGNGRLSRLLTTLLLMKQGYDFIQYVSFENVIESSMDKYYRVFMAGQQNRYKDNEPAQVGDIEKELGEYSRNTLKKDLIYLVQEKLLLKTGERKGTRYHILKRM
jgi:Fic family protein